MEKQERIRIGFFNLFSPLFSKSAISRSLNAVSCCAWEKREKNSTMNTNVRVCMRSCLRFTMHKIQWERRKSWDERERERRIRSEQRLCWQQDGETSLLTEMPMTVVLFFKLRQLLYSILEEFYNLQQNSFSPQLLNCPYFSVFLPFLFFPVSAYWRRCPRCVYMQLGEEKTLRLHIKRGRGSKKRQRENEKMRIIVVCYSQ